MIFFTPKLDAFRSFYERGKFLLAWRLSAIFSFVFLVLSFLHVNESNLVFFFYLTIFLVSTASWLVLQFSRKHEFIYWLYTITATLVVSLSLIFVQNTLHYTDFLWMTCLVLFAFIGLGRIQGIVIMLILALVSSYFFAFRINGHTSEIRIYSNAELVILVIEVLFAFTVLSYLLHQFLIFQRHAEIELTKVNLKLARQNEENTFLVKEVHHRVKNNLQIIISLLKIQREDLTSEESRVHFNDAINRVMTISLVHEKLYGEKELAHINLIEYFDSLVHDIARLSCDSRVDAKVSIESELSRVGLKTIVPLGLLLNELVTNSYKHAFESVEKPMITITMTELSESKIEMIYADNGTWKETNETGFGIELIGLLTSQLDGAYTRSNSAYRFELTNLDHE
jgi:two-component system, sensor histidine kinase PdtaS